MCLCVCVCWLCWRVRNGRCGARDSAIDHRNKLKSKHRPPAIRSAIVCLCQHMCGITAHTHSLTVLSVSVFGFLSAYSDTGNEPAHSATHAKLMTQLIVYIDIRRWFKSQPCLLPVYVCAHCARNVCDWVNGVSVVRVSSELNDRYQTTCIR